MLFRSCAVDCQLSGFVRASAPTRVRSLTFQVSWDVSHFVANRSECNWSGIIDASVNADAVKGPSDRNQQQENKRV